MWELQYDTSCYKYDSMNVPELASIYLVSCSQPLSLLIGSPVNANYCTQTQNIYGEHGVILGDRKWFMYHT